MNPARVDREDERRMLPCRDFLDGHCPRGQHCRFYHPVTNSFPTVPNLPASFQQNSFRQFLSPAASTGGAHSVMTSPNPSVRSHMGLSPRLGLGSVASARFRAGMNVFGNNFSRSMSSSLASPTYSEYELAYAQHMKVRKELERRAAAAAPPIPKNNENRYERKQDTVFNHIDWKEFLTPGACPPPPTHVGMGNSTGRAAETSGSLESLSRAGNSKSQHQESQRKNFFAEKLALAERALTPVSSGEIKTPSPSPIRELTSQIESSRPLSAKEELQMKIKQIAKELAKERAQPVKSMDIFFRNDTFESVPTAPSSEQDLARNSGETEETPHATIIAEETEPIETDLKDDETKVELIAKNASSSTCDSGISSSEFSSSGDSAPSSEQDLAGNSGEIEEETPHDTIITKETEPIETDLKEKDDEMKVELTAKMSSSTSDSGISSSEFTSSGDSASSMECVKDENLSKNLQASSMECVKDENSPEESLHASSMECVKDEKSPEESLQASSMECVKDEKSPEESLQASSMECVKDEKSPEESLQASSMECVKDENSPEESLQASSMECVKDENSPEESLQASSMECVKDENSPEESLQASSMECVMDENSSEKSFQA